MISNPKVHDHKRAPQWGHPSHIYHQMGGNEAVHYHKEPYKASLKPLTGTSTGTRFVSGAPSIPKYHVGNKIQSTQESKTRFKVKSNEPSRGGRHHPVRIIFDPKSKSYKHINPVHSHLSFEAARRRPDGDQKTRMKKMREKLKTRFCSCIAGKDLRFLIHYGKHIGDEDKMIRICKPQDMDKLKLLFGRLLMKQGHGNIADTLCGKISKSKLNKLSNDSLRFALTMPDLQAKAQIDDVDEDLLKLKKADLVRYILPRIPAKYMSRSHHR